jgi:hypothetical protein
VKVYSQQARPSEKGPGLPENIFEEMMHDVTRAFGPAR